MSGATPIKKAKTPSLATLTRNPCNFLSLPLEIRRIIYDFVGSEREVYYCAYKGQLASLLRTSKQVYKDIVPYLYAKEMVWLSLPKHLLAEDRDTFALSYIRRIYLEICDPLNAEESIAGIYGFMRNCPALQELIVDVSSSTHGKEYGKLVHAHLIMPILASFPVLEFRINVMAGWVGWGDAEDRCSLNTFDGKEIPESEIRAKFPTITNTTLQKIDLRLSLTPREFKTLMSQRMGEWDMVKLYESFGWVAGDVVLSWEKMREGVEGGIQQALRTERNLDMYSWPFANSWYEREDEA